MALPRRTSELLGYWRAERRTLRQGLVALALSTIAGFVAGLTLAHITGTLESFPGLIVLIPAAVGMKGTIFGAIAARLGTADAAGLLAITLRRGGVLRRNLDVAILTTFSSSLWLALLSRVMSAAFGERSISLWSLVVISVVGGAIGSMMVLAITIVLSALSHRFGWDLDSVSTPMVTALGDMTTLPSLFLATFLVRSDVLTSVTAVVCLTVALAATVRSYVAPDRAVRRMIVEMTATIALTPLVDVAAGALQQAREAQLFAMPVLLLLIPPFVSQAGAIGGIFSSRISSKLQIGVITPRGRPEIPAIVDATIAMASAIVVFATIGAIAWGLGTVAGLEGIPASTTLIGGTLLAGLIVTPGSILVGYYLAVAAFRFGLDPDNHGVPIITSVMDLSGVGCVLFVMSWLGVLARG
jgi:mgtE-like transporter